MQEKEEEGSSRPGHRVLPQSAPVGAGLPGALDAAASVHPHHGPRPHLQAALSPSGLILVSDPYQAKQDGCTATAIAY